MTDPKPETPECAKQRQRALASWDTEGGAGPDGPQKQDPSGDPTTDTVSQSASNLQQLHIRVIALENLVIALLAGASGTQCAFARDMAGYIAPQPGFTPYPLTTHASHQMLNAIERAAQLRQRR